MMVGGNESGVCAILRFHLTVNAAQDRWALAAPQDTVVQQLRFMVPSRVPSILHSDGYLLYCHLASTRPEYTLTGRQQSPRRSKQKGCPIVHDGLGEGYAALFVPTSRIW